MLPKPKALQIDLLRKALLHCKAHAQTHGKMKKSRSHGGGQRDQHTAAVEKTQYSKCRRQRTAARKRDVEDPSHIPHSFPLQTVFHLALSYIIFRLLSSPNKKETKRYFQSIGP